MSVSNYRPLREAVATLEGAVSLAGPSDPIKAIDWAAHYQPKLAVLDLCRRDLDAADFTRRFRHSAACADIPLLLIVPASDRSDGYAAIDAGADDFLLAPPDPRECRLRLRTLLTLSLQRRVIRQQARWLAHGGIRLAGAIREREKETLLRLARAGECRDETTGAHIARIATLSRTIAEGLALAPELCAAIELAAPLHDIGKIGIPDAVLRKPGPLTPAEREIMERHTLIGYEILKDSASAYLQLGAEIALSHHERFDGNGYPHGLRGEEIPIAARIVAVADAYDALISKRPYKDAWCPTQATAYLKEHSGSRFDPKCVEAFVT